MTDRDVIERVCEMFGTRMVVCKHVIDDRHKKQVFRALLRGSGAVALMLAVRPYMCQRRTARIDEAIASFSPRQGGPKLRFSDDDIREMRRLNASGIGYKRIANRYGCAHSHVANIVTGKKYRHVPLSANG